MVGEDGLVVGAEVGAEVGLVVGAGVDDEPEEEEEAGAEYVFPVSMLEAANEVKMLVSVTCFPVDEVKRTERGVLNWTDLS